jgi:hypothetical protein
MKLFTAILCELCLLAISQHLNKNTMPAGMPAQVIQLQNSLKYNSEEPALAVPIKKPTRKHRAVHKQDSIIEPKKITFVDSPVFKPNIKITRKNDK